MSPERSLRVKDLELLGGSFSSLNLYKEDYKSLNGVERIQELWSQRGIANKPCIFPGRCDPEQREG